MHGSTIKDWTWKRYFKSKFKKKQSPWLRVESLLHSGSLPSSLVRGLLRRQQSATTKDRENNYNLTCFARVKFVFAEGRRMETIKETEDFKELG